MIFTNICKAVALVCICTFIGVANGQENIQHKIPASLVECYNTSFFMNRDNRLPYNIETLISLIEKVENSPNYAYDLRGMSVALLQRFRMDGIERAIGVTPVQGVIPYAPTGFQFPKFRVLLSSLVPGNAFNFPNSSLTREERCSLHFMLSSSIDFQARQNEASNTCNSISMYRRNNRYSRSTQGGKRALDWEFFLPQQQVPNFQLSQCPVENGVIRTKWGTVSAGTVIAGIAAGLEQQNIQLQRMIQVSSRPGMPLSKQYATTFVIDNRWAATLAGDLAEVALLQVPVYGNSSITVGVTGGWNNTVIPKWYFLSQNTKVEMTDAEIRGGIDGLILAMNVKSWVTQYNSLKLSSLLRMYYSTAGVLNSGIMACQRQANFATYAPLTTLAQQAIAFSLALSREMSLPATLSDSIIANFAGNSAQALSTYVPTYLNDVSCPVSLAQAQGLANLTTVMTDLYIYLDTSWQYSTIANFIDYILEQLNIGPQGSTVTLLCASNGSAIVNSTNFITTVYRQWNVTTQANYTSGFNLTAIFQSLQNYTQAYMSAQQLSNSVGGRSMVALLVPNQSGVNINNVQNLQWQLKTLYEQSPDLNVLFFGGGSIQRFSQFVKNATTDLFSLNLYSAPSTVAQPVVARIRTIPRRIINSRCNAQWGTNGYGSSSMTQFLYPGTVNFYRIAPNYFYGNGNGRYVSIQSPSYMQLTVCSSRWIVDPYLNSTTGITSNDPVCTQITSSPYNYDLSNACSGYGTIGQCPPLYLSVQMTGSVTSTGATCNSVTCQAPNQIPYTVSVTNLGCWSGVAHIAASFTLIVFSFILRQVFQ